MMKRATLFAFLAASFGFIPVVYADSELAKRLLNTLPSSLLKISLPVFGINMVGQLSIHN